LINLHFIPQSYYRPRHAGFTPNPEAFSIRGVSRDGSETELLSRALANARDLVDKLHRDEAELSRDAGKYAEGAALAHNAARAAEDVARLLADPSRFIAPTDRDPT